MKNAYMNNDESLGRVHTYSGLYFYRIRTVRSARKAHICLGCTGVIKRGTPYEYHSGLSEGKLYYYHLCLACGTMGK